MHEVCRPLEVPPIRAHVSRTGGGGAALVEGGTGKRASSGLRAYYLESVQ